MARAVKGAEFVSRLSHLHVEDLKSKFELIFELAAHGQIYLHLPWGTLDE